MPRQLAEQGLEGLVASKIGKVEGIIMVVS